MLDFYPKAPIPHQGMNAAFFLALFNMDASLASTNSVTIAAA